MALEISWGNTRIDLGVKFPPPLWAPAGDSAKRFLGSKTAALKRDSVLAKSVDFSINVFHAAGLAAFQAVCQSSAQCLYMNNRKPS